MSARATACRPLRLKPPQFSLATPPDPACIAVRKRMAAIVCGIRYLPTVRSSHHGLAPRPDKQGPSTWRSVAMRTRRRWPALAVAAVLLLTGCSQESGPPSAGQGPAATTSCASNGELPMWERSGGNKQMVEMLVEAGNTKNPGCKINLTYIPHTEMVGKIAQGIASGEVPDLMGMDLIYAPQFEKAQQLVDLTDRIGAWPELKTASQGHMTVATFENRVSGVPLYADVSALFYNKDLFRRAGLDPDKPPTSLAELRAYADKITALGGGIKGYYLPGNCAGCNIFTVGPLMWASGA